MVVRNGLAKERDAEAERDGSPQAARPRSDGAPSRCIGDAARRGGAPSWPVEGRDRPFA